MENMYKLIFIHKIWLCDPWISYLKPINVAFACEVKSDLMVELEAKFKDQVNNENSFKLHDFF
jgi:hypothetical protein